MASCINDTIGGFNTFLETQKAVPGYATLTLVQFATGPEEIVHLDRPLDLVPPLTKETYVPGGGTALHDAIGTTVEELGRRLAAMPEAHRPGKVVVVIITDGEENSSIKFTGSRIKEMIEEQRKTYNWQFVYLGANQDAVTVGDSLGMAKGTSAAYSGHNTGGVFRTMSDNMAAYVAAPAYQGVSKELTFSDEQRADLTAPPSL